MCTFHQALLSSVSRDRTLVCSGSSCFASVPGLQSRRSSVFTTLRSCRRCAWLCGLMVSGHFLDADMLAKIDPSACAVEPIFPPSSRSGHDFPSFPFTGHSSRPGSRRSLVRPLRELHLSPHCDCLSPPRLCPSHLWMRDGILTRFTCCVNTVRPFTDN